jgi:hypothetical protein
MIPFKAVSDCRFAIESGDIDWEYVDGELKYI